MLRTQRLKGAPVRLGCGLQLLGQSPEVGHAVLQLPRTNAADVGTSNGVLGATDDQNIVDGWCANSGHRNHSRRA